MRKFGITFWFYAKEHFKKKSLIILAIFVAATVGIMFAIDHFGGGSYADVAIVQESSSFVVADELFDYVPERNFHFVDSADEAREMLDDGDVSNVFIIQGDARPEMTIVTSHLEPDREVELFLTHVLTAQHLEAMTVQYDLPVDVVEEITTPITIHSEFADLDSLIAVELINMLLPMMIYMLIMLSGQGVANSVASEKTSRVMEVMLGKVHPTITMTSKILSSLLGILLPMVAILLGFVIANIAGIIELEVITSFINEFFSVDALILAVIVLFLGYFCFIFLFAAAGAIANSVESLTSTLTPLIYATMIPLFLPMFLDLDSMIMNILVYVPFVSPYVLVQRFLLGYSGIIEVGIVLVLMAIFGVLTLMISARLYMNGISHTSEKITIKDFKKMLQK